MPSVTPVENSGQFEVALLSHQRTVAKFGATWCGPCKVMAPGFVSVAAASGHHLQFLEVDIDECWQTAEKYGVKSVPTLIIFEGGAEKKRYVGLLTPAKLQSWLDDAELNYAKDYGFESHILEKFEEMIFIHESILASVMYTQVT